MRERKKRALSHQEAEALRKKQEESRAKLPQPSKSGVNISALVSTTHTGPLPKVVVPVMSETPELLEFVGGKLHRWGKRLWSDDSHRYLRRRCMQETLYRQAQLKFHDSMMTFAGSWDLFLQLDSGRQQVARFIDEKVRELCFNEALG